MPDQTPGFRPGRIRRAVTPIARALTERLVGPSKAMRASQFAQLPTPAGHVVMLGDSITQLGVWEEWFAGRPVLNRGISGDTSADLLARVDTAVHDPVAVFLLIGTNDLTIGVALQDIVANVRALLAAIEDRAPGTPVVLQSVMPRTHRYRADIGVLNRAYRALAEETTHVTFLDLTHALVDDAGDLRQDLSADRIHLNGAGYAAWVEVLRPELARFTG
ncbi:GDSL family lipase [Geodermatophilaceae bacterium NBWT11]|nr:GDSL family lipase [Geodermatophilaceae bacterium NBWT11]